MSTIGIIVPVYNVEKYVRRCLDSVLSQTYTDIVVVVVDDGSTDGCSAICDEYTKKDDRIVVIHQNNKGLSSARNTGIDWIIKNRSTNWMCFVDSDDWINSSYIEGLYKTATANECLISVCDFVKTTGNEEVSCGENSHEEVTSPEDLYNRYFYVAQTACCKLFNKVFFTEENYRFPEGMLYEDSAVIYRMLFSQKRISYTSKSIYYYFQNSESITGSDWNPDKMMYCKVMNEQLNWLIENNHKSCVKTCVLHILNSINYQVHSIEKEAKYISYIYELRNYCRVLLKKYAKEYGITLEEYPQFYEAGYPKFINLYWFIKSQISKLKRINH